MELTEPDIFLLKYLSRYAIADIECVKTIYIPYGNKRYYSERLAKLKANKYIALRNKQSVYALLKKGKKALENLGISKLTWYSGSRNSFRRLEILSGTAAMLLNLGIDVLADIPESADTPPVFVPSMLIKAKLPGIDRQSRFAGIIYTHSGNYAVYDLGDGSRIWQPLSEASLFKSDLYEHHNLDGMLFVADEGSLNDIAVKTTITDLSYSRLAGTSKKQGNPLRLLPGYKSCRLMSRSEIILIIKMLSIGQWQSKVIADLFPTAELLGGSPVEPDCISSNALIYLMLDNDLLRAHFLRNYLNACPADDSYNSRLHIYCMENHTGIYTSLFPDIRVIPVKPSKIERILDIGGSLS